MIFIQNFYVTQLNTKLNCIIPPLVAMLIAGSTDEDKEAAAKVLCTLSYNKANKEAIERWGAMPHLVAMLSADADGVKTAAAAALRSLGIEHLQGTSSSRRSVIMPEPVGSMWTRMILLRIIVPAHKVNHGGFHGCNPPFLLLFKIALRGTNKPTPELWIRGVALSYASDVIF